MKRFFDRTLGKWLRHFFFVLVRTYYALFYNVNCTNGHLLQDAPGTLILATHVSRHDGPMILSCLYTTTRVRPTVHWNEYHHPAQRFPMYVSGAIPMSSPKEWPAEKRQAQKGRTLEIIRKVLNNRNAVLLFPAGQVRRQPEEIIKPYLSGVHEILLANPDTPLLLLRTEGLGKFQRKLYDGFWSFLGIKRGRRHVQINLTPITLDANIPLEAFNKQLEMLLNTEIDIGKIEGPRG